MVIRLDWTGTRLDTGFSFKASVPGNIQCDYAEAKGFGDINYADNCKKFLPLEDCEWQYAARFTYSPDGERVHFMSGGIDYTYDISVNGTVLYNGEGMFSKIDIDITDALKTGDNTITVKIYPHPKRSGAPVSRTEADNSVKPPVCYGWDWHPRVLSSGIWNDAYIVTLAPDFEDIIHPEYTLSDDFETATVFFENADSVELYSPCGELVYRGTDREITVNEPKLWWCNGVGEQNLYTWRAVKGGYAESGILGFRRVELVMNEGTWNEPREFPKSRSHPPITVCLNGRRIFAKGSNFVSPEIFPGVSDMTTYQPLVDSAKQANMNIFRMWGGSGVQKDVFYELCDRAGIMVWQEFPLACNNYKGDSHYLEVLEREARSIVKGLKHHPCVVLWCGGNELFNSWSKMTDQSLPLRLLNKICYEEDINTPFIPTSPLSGMAHGGYLFDTKGVEVYEQFGTAHCTAYTEFGVPGTPDSDYLRSFIPDNELFPPERGGSYELHHAFGAWGSDTWLCIETLKKYFGEIDSLEKMCEYSALLQCEGYKAVFEEARRQKPYCSMAINWCYNEPWKTAANNSLLSYPAIPKKAYYAVKDSLRAVLPSAKLSKFSYVGGEELRAELWLLNDSCDCVSDTVSVYLDSQHILDWNTGASGISENIKGHTVSITMPDVSEKTFVTLRLVSKNYGESEYTLLCDPHKKKLTPKVARLNV